MNLSSRPVICGRISPHHVMATRSGSSASRSPSTTSAHGDVPRFKDVFALTPPRHGQAWTNRLRRPFHLTSVKINRRAGYRLSDLQVFIDTPTGRIPQQSVADLKEAA